MADQSKGASEPIEYLFVFRTKEHEENFLKIKQKSRNGYESLYIQLQPPNVLAKNQMSFHHLYWLLQDYQKPDDLVSKLNILPQVFFERLSSKGTVMSHEFVHNIAIAISHIEKSNAYEQFREQIAARMPSFVVYHVVRLSIDEILPKETRRMLAKCDSIQQCAQYNAFADLQNYSRWNEFCVPAAGWQQVQPSSLPAKTSTSAMQQERSEYAKYEKIFKHREKTNRDEGNPLMYSNLFWLLRDFKEPEAFARALYVRPNEILYRLKAKAIHEITDAFVRNITLALCRIEHSTVYAEWK